MKKVVLIQPYSFYHGLPPPPISLLYVAATLINNTDFDWDIIDYNIGQKVDTTFSDTNVIAYGITSRTGDELLSAIMIAKKIKSIRPQVPIIWGGIHINSTIENSIKESFVDIIVMGDSEETFNELISTIVREDSIYNIPGIAIKRDHKIFFTPKRVQHRTLQLNLIPYERINLENYDTNILWMNTSRGCPYNCEFCCSTIDTAGYRAMSVSDVITHLKMYLKLTRPEIVFFTDYNFFTHKKRALDIAQAILDYKIKIKWIAHIVASDICELKSTELRLLKQSGCSYLISGQDGSKKQMHIVGKSSTYKEVERAHTKLHNSGIEMITNYIIGFMEENQHDLFEVINDIKKRTKKYNGTINIYIFNAWPGTPVINRITLKGYQVQNNMMSWSKILLGSADKLNFHSKEYRRFVQTVYYVVSLSMKRPVYVFMNCPNSKFVAINKLILSIMTMIAKARWHSGFYKWGLEWRLIHFIAKNKHRRWRETIIKLLQ
jgi:radical SAM superfamily enzyme YgiQ (UPF0313 family)